MVQVPTGRVVESDQTRKTVGGADLPNTKQPEDTAAFNNTVAPFNHDGNDVSAYIGVGEEYKTYADVRNKPFGVAGDEPDFLVEEVSEPEQVQSAAPAKAPAPASPKSSKSS